MVTVVLPFRGVLLRVSARGKDTGRRDIAQARAQQEAFDARIRPATGTAASGNGTPAGRPDFATHTPGP